MTGGTETSFNADQLINEHGNALYRYALLQLRDSHRAEEAVQETMVSAWQARDRFRGDSNVRTWLIGILKRKIIDQFRQQRRETPLESDNPVPHNDEPGPDDQFKPDGHWAHAPANWGNPQQLLENGQFWELLQYCLERIPEKLAQIFILREIQEESTKNICKELSITPSNLWTTLYRARMGLRKCLDRNWEGSC